MGRIQRMHHNKCNVQLRLLGGVLRSKGYAKNKQSRGAKWSCARLGVGADKRLSNNLHGCCGHLHVLEWIHKGESLRDDDDWGGHFLAGSCRLHILKWAHGNGFHSCRLKRTRAYIVKWNGFRLSSRRASLSGNLEFLWWAYQTGNLVPTNYIVTAPLVCGGKVAGCDHLEILKICARKWICEPDTSQCMPLRGFSWTFEWLELNQLPLEIQAFADAAAAAPGRRWAIAGALSMESGNICNLAMA